MMAGFFPAFLTTPTMTGGHLLFALLSCGYILFGVRPEEHDLADTHPEYRAYIDYGAGDVVAVYAETFGYGIIDALREHGLAITRRR